MPLLSIESVSKTYAGESRQPAPVLREASLSLRAGECVAVWGEPASGKTTLLQLVAGLQSPDLGTVRLNGEDVRRPGASAAALGAGQLGWAGDGALPAHGLHVLDCVALSLIGTTPIGTSQARARAYEALAIVGMARRAQTRCERLSPVERVLVGIARAIVHGPKLLLADDPAGRLAGEQRESIVTLLRELAEERSIGVLVTVSHIASVVHAHRMASLSRGRLLAPEQLAARRRPVQAHENVVELRSRRYAVR